MRARVEPQLYVIASAEQIQTPALAIYLDFVEHNISTTLRILGGNPNRWRPHIQNSKDWFDHPSTGRARSATVQVRNDSGTANGL
jgi:hypothetical protein